MIISLLPWLRFLLPKYITAITLWPFIVFRDKKNSKDLIIINHERIHLKQQLELLILPFYVLYLSEYIFYLSNYRNHSQAYMAISFEKEAYKNDRHLDYIKDRKWFAMWR